MEPSKNEPPYAALIGIDWADQQHDYCLGVVSSDTVEIGVIASRPEDVAAWINRHERPQDPRLVEGSIEKTRVKFHANDGVNLYGQQVDGVLIGQGTGS